MSALIVLGVARRRYLPDVPRSFVALMLGAALVATLGTALAKVRIEDARWRRQVCAAELKALVARNLFVEKFLRPDDPCLALEVARR